MAAVLLVAAYGAITYRPSSQSRTTEKKAVIVAPRTKVAVIGVRSELGTPELKWLPAAVKELLTHEVAAAESSLRVVTADQVDVEQRSLGVTGDDVGDERTQRRLQALLDADVFVYAVLSVAERQTDDVRLRVRALEAESGRERGRLDEDLGPGAARLLEAISGAGTGIRNLLRASLSSEEEAALTSSRARNLDAAKAYAEGVMVKQRWDLDGARSYFEAALAAAPSFLQAKQALAHTWIAQYHRRKAVEVLKSISATTAALTARQAAIVELRITQDPDKLRALFEAAPDDLDVWPGLALTSRLPARASLQLLKRMQQLRAGMPLDLELRQAEVADAPERGEELLDDVARRAKELGARWELARARTFQAARVSPHDPTRRKNALDRFREAERLYAEMGELDNLAEAKRGRAAWLDTSGSRREALTAMDEAAGLFRRLGNRELLTRTLQSTAEYMRELGELAAARRRIDEARRELEALDAPRDGFGFFNGSLIRAWQDLDAGNLDAAREGIRAARRTTWGNSFPHEVALLEARVLKEEDHVEEARATYSKAVANAPDAVAGMCAIDCDRDDPAAGLECLAQKCRADDPEFVGLRKASCHLEEAQCSLRGSDFVRADRAARDAAAVLERKDDYELSLLTRSVLSRVAASRGDAAYAIGVLRADLMKTESEGNKRLAFETALALGEVEIKAGRRDGRARLAQLEQEAKSREFFRIARLAREALDRKPVATVTPHR